MTSREWGGGTRDAGGRYRTFFQVEFPSTFTALSEALSNALKALQEHRWIGPDEEFFARLCLEEALVNAIIHGNKSDERRKVRLEMAETGDRCRIRVYDEGSGFVLDTTDAPDGRKPNGRGLCLIRHCMDTVRFDTEEKYLEMTIRRRSLGKEGKNYGGSIASHL